MRGFVRRKESCRNNLTASEFIGSEARDAAPYSLILDDGFRLTKSTSGSFVIIAFFSMPDEHDLRSIDTTLCLDDAFSKICLRRLSLSILLFAPLRCLVFMRH